MSLKQKLTAHLMERCGGIVDIKESPEVLDEIVNEVKAHLEAEQGTGQPVSSKSSAPFGVPWMDSWVANHVFAERVSDLQSKNREVASLLQGMVEVQFNARLGEIRDIIGERLASPPDGGTPEPGVPPVGPAGPARVTTASEPGSPPVGPAGAGGSIFRRPSEPGTPPDAGGPPVGPAGARGSIFTASEPGSPPVGPAGSHAGSVFNEPPDGGPPEPGVPPEPPAGPDPPGGPDAGRFGSFADNPWILYWFISLKTPMLLDVIDLHISRRLDALRR